MVTATDTKISVRTIATLASLQCLGFSTSQKAFDKHASSGCQPSRLSCDVKAVCVRSRRLLGLAGVGMGTHNTQRPFPRDDNTWGTGLEVKQSIVNKIKACKQQHSLRGKSSALTNTADSMVDDMVEHSTDNRGPQRPQHGRTHG